MDKIKLGTIDVPISDYASQGNAVLGIRDSGKTYAATRIAEQLLAHEIPIVAFDPIGVWRFLRHAGTKSGFPLIVVGGDDGDLKLTKANAVPILRHAMREKHSIVFDLYDMDLSKADWHAIVAECVRTLLYENRPHGLRHIFIEEAAEFVPQMISGEQARVYAEIEKLARMGGNSMLGFTLINQRAEQLNKAVLELCDCLLLGKQKGRLSLQALTKWLDFGDQRKTKGIIGRMPVLEQGQFFVWAGGSESPVETKIPAKVTFVPDRRAHKEPGEKYTSAHLLEGFTPDEEEPAPPKKGAHMAAAPAAAPEPIEIPVFETGEITRLDLALRQLQDGISLLQTIEKDITAALKRADIISDRRTRPAVVAAPPLARRVQANATHAGIGKGPFTILQTLAAKYPLVVSQSQLGTLSGYTPSTMRTYLPGLKEMEAIEILPDGYRLTPQGKAMVGTDFQPIPKERAEMLAFWMQKLTRGEGECLRVLFQAKGRPISQDTLCAQTGFTASTVRTYLPRLRKNNLIHETELRISAEFLG